MVSVSVFIQDLLLHLALILSKHPL